MTTNERPCEALRTRLEALRAEASKQYESLAKTIKEAEREMCRTPAGRSIHRSVEDAFWNIPYALEQLEKSARHSIENLGSFLATEKKP